MMTYIDMPLPFWFVAAPEMVLLALICVVLVADLFIEKEQRIWTFWMSIATLAVTMGTVMITGPFGQITVMDGAYVSDSLSYVLKLAAIGFVGLAFFYARDYLRANDLHKGEYYVLGLFGLLGIMIMISANSLLIMYLGLETMALSIYALVAIDRNNVVSAESAMKYFVLGAIASGMLLYGISMIYGATGSIEFATVAKAAAEQGMDNEILVFGLVFLLIMNSPFLPSNSAISDSRTKDLLPIMWLE